MDYESSLLRSARNDEILRPPYVSLFRLVSTKPATILNAPAKILAVFINTIDLIFARMTTEQLKDMRDRLLVLRRFL